MIPATGHTFKFAFFAKLGIAAIVQLQSGLTVTVYNVASKRPLQSGNLSISPDINIPAGRMALHGPSDTIEQWIFTTAHTRRWRTSPCVVTDVEPITRTRQCENTFLY